jgi:hypothetical protein
MSNIQKTLDSLQPYVIGIRYLEGTPLVDAVFKEGWTVPEDPTIKKLKGNDELNYFMIFSETIGVGLDELLDYVAKTIKINEEREKKHELLKVKVNELKEIFKRTPLNKLTNLKFTFPEEDLVPKLDDFELDDTFVEEVIETPKSEPIPQTYLDENNKPIELTDEEKEMLEEETRAERNRKALLQKKNNNNLLSCLQTGQKRFYRTLMKLTDIFWILLMFCLI